MLWLYLNKVVLDVEMSNLSQIALIYFWEVHILGIMLLKFWKICIVHLSNLKVQVNS